MLWTLEDLEGRGYEVCWLPEVLVDYMASLPEEAIPDDDDDYPDWMADIASRYLAIWQEYLDAHCIEPVE